MANPKDGATREKDGKTQRYNAYTGRWVTQTSPIKNARLLIKSRQEKQDKDKKAKSTWTSGKGLGVGDRGKVSKESDSPQNLKKRFTKDTTSKTGPFGGKNLFKSKSPGSDFKNTPDLKLGTKYKDGKPVPTTSTKETKKKPDDLASLKKKLKRHAGGRSSVAKTKLKLKIRKLEGKK